MIGADERAPRSAPSNDRTRWAAFGRYTVALTLVAAPAAAAAGLAWRTEFDASRSTMWVFAGFVIVGELLPIRVPRRTHVEEVTLSSVFALALAFIFGALPALAVYAGACLVTDLVNRTAPIKVAFNLAASVLSLAAAALVLGAWSTGPPVTLDGVGLLPVLLAILTFFAVDNLLAALGVAFLSGETPVTYMRRDAPINWWTSGFLLTLAPLAVAAERASVWMVALLSFPMLAIYLGGRFAVRSAHRALHDELTGLPNRTMLRLRLDEVLREASTDEAAWVLLIDLDDFRAINDTLGHHHGDALLQALAHRIEEIVDEDDFLARLGGDEFGIVTTGRRRGDDPGAAAKHVAEILATPFHVADLAIEVRASIGVARFPNDGDSARELVQHADVALHNAKERHTLYEVYAEERDEYTVDRLLLAGQLRRGIEGGQLTLYYQPKVTLADGRIRAVEALVRWQHPELGLLGPQAFVPLAEHTGLIEQLTSEVLDTALAQCAAWRSRGLEILVAVNLSPRSLLDAELPGRIARVLARWHLPASALQVEITETSVVSEIDSASRVLDELHRMGVSCAIDDFGTGYSSLVQLQRLHVDEIKIDKSFVLSMDTSRDDEAIVRSTIELGRSLGLRVTAEGVQSARVSERLSALGCDYAQGFHFGHPLPADACNQALRPLPGPEALLDA
jgi:diguanylate cyclase (GGDEF)-like protein